LFSELFNQKSILPFEELLLNQKIWKGWIHLLFSSLVSYHNNRSHQLSSTTEFRTPEGGNTVKGMKDSDKDKNTQVQFDLMRRQNLSLNDLINKLLEEDKVQSDQNQPGPNKSSSVSGTSMKTQILSKLILSEVFCPSSGIGKEINCIFLQLCSNFLFSCFGVLQESLFLRYRV
jgi:hypothetical protein